LCTVVLGAAAALGAAPSWAQDPHPGDPGYVAAAPLSDDSGRHRGSAGINPPEKTDMVFLVDVAPGLDTGCVFNDRSPLVFDIPVDRVIGGDVAALVAKGLLSDTVELTMPAYDVDYDASAGNGNAPERDRVTFNGRVVPGQFLKGSNNVWHKNTFRIPVAWLQFPPEPAPGAGVTAQPNRVEIHIDTQNAGPVWCTQIDWASLTLRKAPRPVVGVHGIFSDGDIWDDVWVANLRDLGIPMSHLNMGALNSIQANAGQIATHVAGIKRHYGVDKVNIVAHSKGGIDARHFVESGENVEHVLQLGTPNAGSPWAEIVQAGSLAAFGLPATIVVNALAGPAGLQLTTAHMRDYNRRHGLNPKVGYTSVAGHYNPGCLPTTLFCQMLYLVAYVPTLGPSDGIVPVWSAHSLAIPCEPTFYTDGFNFDALHIRLHASAELFARHHKRLYPETGGCVKAQDVPVGTATATRATGSVGGQIPAGQTRTHTIPIDQTVPTMFTLLYPSGTLGFTLISPSGQRIDPALAATDPGIAYESGDILGGRAAIYGLPSPEVGLWTVEISAGALASPLPYLAQAQLRDADVVLAGPADNTATAIGGQVTLRAALTDAGQPVTSATVNARIGRPDGTVGDFALRDDGVAPDPIANDGAYHGRVADHKFAGFQPVAFSATGARANGAAFSRETFHLLTVSAGQSAFTGTLSDAGEDTNGDGLFNHLVVRAEIDAGVAGSYRLFGELADLQGNTHQAAAVVSLPAGRSTVALRFDGEAIFDKGVDGPYTVASLRLSEETADGSLPAAELAAPFTTGAYPFSAFQHRPIRVSGNSTSAGVDTDGDRLFDRLDIAIDVAVDNAGFYEWSGVLVDRNGNELGFAAGSGTLVAGTNLVAFRFDAVPIGQAGVDGPYYLRDVLILGGGTNAIVDLTFATLPFRANQFEGYRGTPAAVTPVPIGGPFIAILIGLALAGCGIRHLRSQRGLAVR
jgi:hypothetical protein